MPVSAAPDRESIKCIPRLSFTFALNTAFEFRHRDGSWSPQFSKGSHRTGSDFRGGPARFVHLQTRPKVAIPSNRASVSAGRMFPLNPPHPARCRRSSTVGVSYKMHSSVGPRSRVLYGHVRWAVRSRLQSTATTAPGRDSPSVNPESGRPMAFSYSNAPAPSHGPDPGYSQPLGM